MNSITCPNCGVQNPPNMSFCANCGKSLAAQPQNQGSIPNSGAASDLPPTMLSYQPNLQPNPATPPITPSTQPNAPKKGNKGLIFGLIGCGALVVLGVIGVGIAAVVGGVFNFGSNKKDIDINVSNSKNLQDNKDIDDKSSKTESTMYSELQKLKQIGAFKQTDLKTVNAKDFFPSATDVAQATYYNGSKYVISTLGKFSSNQDAFDDFDRQIKNVKAAGGNIYSNETKNGTKASLYKYNGYYFIEACGDAVCSRNNSDDLNALRSFATSFGSAVKNASYQSSSSTDNAQTISSGVVNGKATDLVQPAYPAAAKAVHASGAVNVQVTIDESGNVISAKAVSGHPLLRQSAEQAARASKFSPTIMNGQAVKVSGIVVYNFVEA